MPERAAWIFNVADMIRERKFEFCAWLVFEVGKNWAEADKIRNELKSQEILLEDRPDGTTDWRRE